MTLLMVTAAGAAGVAARYGISNLFHGDLLPWTTVGINVVGSFLLGLLIVMPLAWVDPQARVALGVGFLGGFTTFSTFSVQALTDFDAGDPGRAFLYSSAWPPPRPASTAAGRSFPSRPPGSDHGDHGRRDQVANHQHPALPPDQLATGAEEPGGNQSHQQHQDPGRE